MIDVYVLDSDLNPIGIVDSYKSLIWANRYWDVGDCELYVTANVENINLLQEGRYLLRTDDEMICQIRKIETDTDAENGNYLIVTGYDAKKILDQRIFWTVEHCKGNVETFIRNNITTAFMTASHTQRRIYKSDGTTLLLKLGAIANLPETVTEQISYKSIGEKIREYCKTYNWGYRLILDNGQLAFSFYKGTDKSDTVVFSDYYENLASTKYVRDASDIGNSALIGGSGEDSARAKETYGYDISGINRFEKFIDAKDVSRELSYGELTSQQMYPNGHIANAGTGYDYWVDVLDVQIITMEQRAQLLSQYADYYVEDITVDGVEFLRIHSSSGHIVSIANMDTNTPSADTKVNLYDVIYDQFLINRGKERLAELGEKETFEGSVFPDVTFIYKQDYNLGDVVKVENQFGISATARITEVVEVFDENGHTITPKFENWEVL